MKFQKHKKKLAVAGIALAVFFGGAKAFIYFWSDGKIYKTCGIAGGLSFNLELKKGYRVLVSADWPDFSKAPIDYIVDPHAAMGANGSVIINDCQEGCRAVSGKLRLVSESALWVTGVLSAEKEEVPFTARVDGWAGGRGCN